MEQSASLFLAFTVLIGGSGKTENAKISLVHLTNMFHARSDKGESAEGGKKGSWLIVCTAFAPYGHRFSLNFEL